MLILTRTKYTNDSIQGELSLDGLFLGYTLELPWNNNAVGASCVPSGTYKLVFDDGGRFNDEYGHECIKLDKVTGRSEILLHKGNLPKHTKGCILIGSSAGTDAVWSSDKAYNLAYKYISKAMPTKLKITGSERLKKVGTNRKE